jgi:hypothetical protein
VKAKKTGVKMSCRRQAARRCSDKGRCPKGESLLNRYEVRDIERKGEKGEGRRGEVKDVKSKAK